MSCRKWEIHILRWQAGELDRESEVALLRHLESCVRCRSTAEGFSEVDRFLLESPAPPVPSVFNQRIVSHVTEHMRQDAEKSFFGRVIASFTFVRPVLVGMILLVGIGLGVFTGLNLSRSILTGSTGSSYDVLALAGIADGQSVSALDALWTDAQGGGR